LQHNNLNNLKKPFALKASLDYISAPRQTRFVEYGEVSERLKEHAWKVCIREIVSRVRISPSPPSSEKPLEAMLPRAFCILVEQLSKNCRNSGVSRSASAKLGFSLPPLSAPSDKPAMMNNRGS
jgi:hypothetical protein